MCVVWCLDVCWEWSQKVLIEQNSLQRALALKASWVKAFAFIKFTRQKTQIEETGEGEADEKGKEEVKGREEDWYLEPMVWDGTVWDGMVWDGYGKWFVL